MQIPETPHTPASTQSGPTQGGDAKKIEFYELCGRYGWEVILDEPARQAITIRKHGQLIELCYGDLTAMSWSEQVSMLKTGVGPRR